MKLNRYINMAIFFPLIGAGLLSIVLEFSNNEIAFELMGVVFICIALIITSSIFLVIKFILDKLNREKVFVTSCYSVEECKAKSRLLERKGNSIYFTSEKSDEIILYTTLPGYPKAPGEVSLSFQSDGDRTVIRCKVKELVFSTIISTVGYLFFGIITCSILYNLITQTIAGMELSQAEYGYWVSTCVISNCLVFIFYGQIARTWKRYRGFFDSKFQATEVVDRKKFVRQFF